VKISTLNLISKIGNEEKYKKFANKSFKYIIELINDEEDEVRFHTVKCLQSLCRSGIKIDVKYLN
jgi:hypothetical protein